MEQEPLDIRQLTPEEELALQDSLAEADADLAEGRTKPLRDVLKEQDQEESS